MNNELQLSVSELKLGNLTTNAIEIREKIKEKLPKYESKNYSENNIQKAKDDKALLNNTSKMLNEERIRLEKEFMKPFEDNFKSIITETVDLIKEASSKIDVIVKDVENKAKEDRKNIIVDIFNTLVGELKELITLEQVFNDKWLNKGSFNDKGEFKLVNELEDKLNKIRNDLEVIKNLNSEHELALTNQYLKDFDLGKVIIENNRLNELKVNTQKVEVAREEKREAKVEEMITKPVEVEEVDPIKTYTLKITGTLSQQIKLKEFLDLNNMIYEKVE